MMYDAGLYDHDDEEDEVEVCIFMPLPRFQAFISYSRANFICFLQAFGDFLQEMVSLMNDARKEVRKLVFYFEKWTFF